MMYLVLILLVFMLLINIQAETIKSTKTEKLEKLLNEVYNNFIIGTKSKKFLTFREILEFEFEVFEY